MAYLKPPVNYIQQVVPRKWDVVRSVTLETNTRATQEIVAPGKSWGDCNSTTSNWPYQGHKVPYLVWRPTDDYLPALWPNCNHWTRVPVVCSVRAESWWILHSSLGTFFETIPKACIIEFPRETGAFYLIWMAIFLLQHNHTCAGQLKCPEGHVWH